MVNQKVGSSGHKPTSQITQKKCGIIMPISEIAGYPASHWREVLKLIKETITPEGYHCDLVSNSNEVNIIQKTIVENIYKCEIIICDVSAKNPNVMFELGMRLTFDKPTIIICDTDTVLPFDTGMIEHVIYPADLNYWGMVEFKEKLLSKVNHTYDVSISDKNYSPFIKHFGAYKVPELEAIDLTTSQFILKSIDDLRQQVALMRVSMPNPNTPIANTVRSLEAIEIARKDFAAELYYHIKDLLQNNSTLTESDLHAAGVRYYLDLRRRDDTLVKIHPEELKEMTGTVLQRLKPK